MCSYRSCRVMASDTHARVPVPQLPLEELARLQHTVEVERYEFDAEFDAEPLQVTYTPEYAPVCPLLYTPPMSACRYNRLGSRVNQRGECRAVASGGSFRPNGLMWMPTSRPRSVPACSGSSRGGSQAARRARFRYITARLTAPRRHVRTELAWHGLHRLASRTTPADRRQPMRCALCAAS